MGKVIWYKVQYVTKGFAQIPRLDFNKTTALTTQLKSL